MSRFQSNAGALFFCATGVAALALAATAAADTPAGVTQMRQVVADQSGRYIGEIPKEKTADIVILPNNTTRVPVYTHEELKGIEVSPSAPPASATKTIVFVTVPSSSMVGFCIGSDTYDRSTGKCGNGKAPSKLVPVSALSDPAAQSPSLTCKAPMVPTFSPATKKWSCLVPPGFKLSLGSE